MLPELRVESCKAPEVGKSLKASRCTGGDCCAAGGASVAGRREFLKAAGAAAALWQADVLSYASSLLAAEAGQSARKPRVSLVWFRKEKGGGCVWPPSSTEELDATQALETKILREAASQHEVDLTVVSRRVTDVAATLAQVRQSKPDGLIVIAADFNLAPMIEFCQKRGEIPAVVYGNIVHMGRSFEPLRRLPKTLLAHTDDVQFLSLIHI